MVKTIHTHPNNKFTITKYSTLKIINQLQNNLTVTKNNKNTNILNLTYTNKNHKQIHNILNNITHNYQKQNIKHKSTKASKNLTFLTQQLPKIHNHLNITKNKLNTFHQNKNSINLPLKTKTILNSIININTQLNKLTFKKTKISKLYTKVHPTYHTLLKKHQTLKNKKAKLNNHITTIPKTQQKIIHLTHNIKSNQQIYIQLLNKKQKLKITKTNTINNVHIVNPTITQPNILKPKKKLIILKTIILNLILSIINILLHSLFNHNIKNPQILKKHNINIYTNIPLSK